MKYSQLPQTYRDDTLAEALYARELEFFHYDFDRRNFEHLLTVLPDGQHHADIEQRLASTMEQMAMVENIYNALLAQITDPDAHAAAVARVTEKRETK